MFICENLTKYLYMQRCGIYYEENFKENHKKFAANDIEKVDAFYLVLMIR